MKNEIVSFDGLRASARATAHKGESMLLTTSRLICGCIVAMFVTINAEVRGDTIFTGSKLVEGVTLKASADFSVNASGDLILVLANTSGDPTLDPATTLNAVFFNATGLNWAPSSATLTNFPTGSQAYYDKNGSWAAFSDSIGPTFGGSGSNAFVDPNNSYDAKGNVGGEWATVSGQNSVAGDNQEVFNFGVSSTGIGPFGPGQRIDQNQNLGGPAAPDGNEFGLMSTKTLQSAVPSALQGNNNNPLAANSVTFDLGHVGQTFNPNTIAGVQFFYGTGLGENYIDSGPGTTVVAPLPRTFAVGSILISGLLLQQLFMFSRSCNPKV